ncbi:zeaxanthin epoxidase [Talaromyces pinophilus]|uniref:Zeaxanthin epoxidase n=1 Tax=Talaromyces pinophilus TaxID=128442 RepID=A0A6V8HTI4_TALPI|nr:zeaxanthin epoxidase [Talaromyces pinophilus]
MISESTESTTETPNNTNPPFEVSIIGGGIIGLNLALGLLRRNIPVAIYEKASELKGIGAGIGFSATVQECMSYLDPRISAILSKIGFVENQPLRWVDASKKDEDFSMRGPDELFDMKLPLERSYVLCHRAVLVDELVKLLPEGCLRLGKRLEGIEQRTDTGKVVMSFMDGTKVESDAVVLGCDGIKSHVRYLLAGEGNPSGIPHYAKESAYRCIIKMSEVVPILGNYASVMAVWVGRGASLVTYPVSNKVCNFAAFVRDNDRDWPDYSEQTVQASKAEIIGAFVDFNPMIRRLLEVLPDQQSRWGLFDTLDYPLQSYVDGCVAVAGDAAHGSTPHHGMGAGIGIEDAVVLVTILEKANQRLSSDAAATPESKRMAISRAFETYDAIRRERSQWHVASSRRQGQLNKWELPEIRNADDFVRDTMERASRVYTYNWRLEVQRSIQDYEQKMANTEE